MVASIGKSREKLPAQNFTLPPPCAPPAPCPRFMAVRNGSPEGGPAGGGVPLTFSARPLHFRGSAKARRLRRQRGANPSQKWGSDGSEEQQRSLMQQTSTRAPGRGCCCCCCCPRCGSPPRSSGARGAAASRQKEDAADEASAPDSDQGCLACKTPPAGRQAQAPSPATSEPPRFSLQPGRGRAGGNRGGRCFAGLLLGGWECAIRAHGKAATASGRGGWLVSAWRAGD